MIIITITIDDEHQFMQCQAHFPVEGTAPNHYEEAIGRSILKFIMTQANKRYPEVGSRLIERDLPTQP